jgi:outer membrane protein, heavy metal efflux system
MRQNGIIVFLTMFLISSTSWAQESVQLTLAKALSLAQENNPRMIEARQSINMAQGEKMSASSLPNPELEVEPDTLTVKQPFGPLGARGLKGKIAQNNIKAQEYNLQSVWADVYVEVRETYSGIILYNKELELQRSNLKAMRQFFSNVQIKYEGGQVFKNQFQRAKIELLKSESAYLKAENDLNVLKAKLNLLLGKPRSAVFEIQEDLKEEILDLGLEHLTNLALKSPEVFKQELELDSKIKNMHKEQLSRLPSYAVGFQRSETEDGDDVGVVFEVSFPLWGLNQGEVKKATADRKIQEAKLEAFKNELDFNVYKLYQDAELGRKQLTLYKKSLDEANEMFRLASLRYKEGDLSFMEYLDQVKSSMDSRMQYYQGLYALSSSISRLERTVHASLRGEEFLK